MWFEQGGGREGIPDIVLFLSHFKSSALAPRQAPVKKLQMQF